MSTGFVLNIPQEMLSRLEDADKKIEKLAKTSGDAQTRIVSAFKSINTYGIDAFINKLTEAQTKLANLGNTKVDFSANASIFSSLTSNARKAIDEVNNVVAAIGKIKTASGETGKMQNPFLGSGISDSLAKLNAEIEQAKRNFSELQNQFTHLNVPAGDKSGLTNIQNEAQFLMEYIRVLEKEKNGLIAAKNALAEANKTLQQKDPFKAKVDDLSRESLEALRYKDSMQAMKEFYAEQDKEMKKAAKEAEADRKKAAKEAEADRKKREKEEKATAERIATYDSKARKERYKAYTSTYEGAMRTSDRAKTLLQEQQAIKNLEAARAKLNKTDSDYANKLRNLNQRILEHKNNIDKATAGSKNLQKQHRSLMDISGQLARKLALVFSVSQITGYVKKLIEVRGEFELQQRSLQAILQNKDEANRIWQQTVDLAVRSPFRVKELVSYTKQLAAYRIESDKLFETNKMLADISAGLGVDMQRLILAFGQVRSAAYLRGTELRQFTEAGIPILEQLAQYFTELEGRAVSVGDVFERVSKRMVSFADVEEIFKRMTSEGGTFYRMQEIQAETLQGQISNLKDSVDIMLNDIGKAHQDTLASSVAFVRSVVQNWRLLATAIQQAGFALAGFSAVKIIRALRLTGDALVEATVKTKGLTAATAKLKLAMMDLGKWVKANPYLLVAGLIASAAHALVQYGKSVDAMNEKYDEMSQRELRRVDTLKELNEQAEKNNQAIKDAIAEQDNASEGTDEYATAEENLSRARGKNISLLERLKKEYPEVYASITKQEDGTVDLTRAIEEQNKVAQRQIALQQQAKGGFFQQDFSTNYEDAVEAFGKYQAALEDVRAQAYVTHQDLLNALNVGDISQESFDSIVGFIDQLKSAKDLTSVREILKQINATIGGSDKLSFKFVTNIQKATQGLSDAFVDYSVSLKNFRANILPMTSTIGNEVRERLLDPERGEESAKEYIDGVLDQFGVLNKEVRLWARDEIVKIINVDLVWGEGSSVGGDEELDGWAKRVDAAIKDINDKVKRDSKNISDADLFPRPKAGQTKEAYLALAKEVIGIAEMTYNETQQIEDEAMVNRTKALSPYADEVKKILNLFKDNNKGKDDEAVKILNKRIGLIKEMYSEYQKGEKVIGEAAEKQVSDAYAKTFKEAFEDTGINLTGLVVDKEKLTELQNAGNEAGEVFSEAMLAKMNEVAETGTHIRNISDKAKDQIKLDEGFVGYIYDDAEKSKVKTQIKTLEELYKYFDKVTGEAKEVKGQGTLTIGYGHALQTLDEAKKYLGITLEQADAEELLTKDIKDRVAPLNTLLDKYNELIVTQEQYDTLFNNFYQGGLSRALRMAFSDSTSELEGYIKGLDEDLSSWGSSFAQEWGDNWLEEFKQLETKAERFAKVLEIASVTTVASGSHIDKNLFYGENAMKARSARRAAEFRGDLEVVKLLEKAAVEVSQIDFTNIEGVVAILERLRPVAEKEGEEAVNTLNQAISKFTAEIGFTTKKDADKILLSQVQEFFDRYDLSLELKKLNIPSDLAKSLFDVDYLDLDGLKKAVQEQEAKFIGTDMEDEYKKFLEKIDDMEDKAAKERMKTYVKYLQEGMSERVKLKIEELRKLKEIEESDEFTPAQKERIKANVSKEARAEQQAQEWKDFQGSEMYTMMFEDLEFLGTKALDVLKNKLEELNGSLKDLPASEVKEIIGQISKIEDITIQRNPFTSLREAMKEVRELESKGRTEEVLQEELAAAELKRQSYQEELDAVTLILGAKENEIDLNQQSEEWQEKYAMYLGMQTSELEQQSMALSALVTGQGMVASNAAKDLKAYADARKALSAVSNEWGTIKSLAEKAYGSVKEVLESMGVESDSVAMSLADSAMNMVDLVFQAVMFDMQLKVMTAQAQLLGVAMNTALGPIGWIVLALQAVATVLSAIFSAKDKALQKEIDGHLARAEKLHEKYEELSDAIDSAYDASVVRQLNKEIEKTIKLEIEAIEAAIAAEKAQKASKIDWDWVDEQEKAVKDLYGTLNEEHDNYIERWGGFGSEEARFDFIESMTQAWLDSFKETGDGLAGLEEKWDEYFDNLAMKQMALRVSKAAIDKYLDMWDKYVSAESAGGEDLTEAEAQDLRLKKEQLLKDLSEKYTSLAESLGITPTTESAGLSGLTKSIQGVSESTAQVLESLLSSMRFYVADSNSKLGLLLQSMGVSTIENPQLVELRTQTMVLNEINAKIASLNETVGGLIVNDRLKVTATTQLDQLIRPRANGGVGLNIVND